MVVKLSNELDSDTLVAPHHCADNASSLRFIKNVSPTYVLFQAGNRNEYQVLRKKTICDRWRYRIQYFSDRFV